jgi:hypothetical protein
MKYALTVVKHARMPVDGHGKAPPIEEYIAYGGAKQKPPVRNWTIGAFRPKESPS